MDPRKKAIFCEFFEIINEDVDIEFVRLNKHNLKIHLKKNSFILYTFYTEKRHSKATRQKVPT